MSWKNWILIGEFFAALGLFHTFVVVYHLTTGGQWRRSISGRFVMSFSASLAWLMDLAVINGLARSYPFRDELRLVSYAVLVLVAAQQLRLLLLAQRSRRQAKHAALKEARARERNGFPSSS